MSYLRCIEHYATIRILSLEFPKITVAKLCIVFTKETLKIIYLFVPVAECRLGRGGASTGWLKAGKQVHPCEEIIEKGKADE